MELHRLLDSTATGIDGLLQEESGIDGLLQEDVSSADLEEGGLAGGKLVFSLDPSLGAQIDQVIF